MIPTDLNWGYWVGIVFWAMLGVLGHYFKKMMELNASVPDGQRVSLSGYWKSNLYETGFLVISLMIALLITYRMGELNYVSAALWGYSLNSASDAVGRRSKMILERVTDAQSTAGSPKG